MYFVGQKVCLWNEVITTDRVTVVKEVLVTITETKTGVLGEFTRNPVTSTSLRGMGDDGKVYEKHWNYWPESQTNCFTGQWSMRKDGEGANKYWIPKEAVHAYSELKRFNEGRALKLVRKDFQGNPVAPKGDVIYCSTHDEYDHQGTTCFYCHMEEKKAA